MSAANGSFFFRRRTIGRAASPPTWACYEQIPYGDDEDDDEFSDSASDSCSEDDEDYARAAAAEHDDSMTDDESEGGRKAAGLTGADDSRADPAPDIDMDVHPGDDDNCAPRKGGKNDSPGHTSKDVKGKQRAIEPESESKTHHRKKRKPPVYTLRPILTIQKSQGFVWNQDLFVPPYIKDRYVASTSPPNARGFFSTTPSSTNPALTDYEVEVVEIRVKEGDLDSIVP